MSSAADESSSSIHAGIPAVASTSAPGAPVAVRKNLSCLECKRRKVKCDRKFPCSPCLVRGEPEKCKEVVRWESSGGTAMTPGPAIAGTPAFGEDAEASTSGAGAAGFLPPGTPTSHASTAAALQAATNYSNMAAAAAAAAASPGGALDAATGQQILNELRKLSSMVRGHVDRWDGDEGDVPLGHGSSYRLSSNQFENSLGKRKADGSLHDDQGREANATSSAGQTMDSAASKNAIDRPTRPSDEEVQMLEEFALSHRAKRGRIVDALEEDGAGGQGSAEASHAQQGQHRATDGRTPNQAHLSTAAAPYGDSATLPSPDVIELAAELLSSGPSPDLTRALGTHYFERVDFLTRCVDRVRYMQLRERLLSFVDPLEAVRSVPVSFICVHLALLAAALHYFDDEQDATRLGLGEAGPSANELSLWCAAAARRLLFATNFFASPEVDHLACVVVLSQVECDCVDLVEANWALIGSAIRVAQNLGLGRLSETARGRKVASMLFASRAEMELAKRVWWNLIHLDYAHGTAHRGQYALQPWHNETARPANADVVDGNVVDAAKSAYTQASFLLARVQLIEIDRDIVEARLAPNTKHYTTRRGDEEDGPSFVSSIDKRVSDIMDGLPKELQLEYVVEAESTSSTVKGRIQMMESLLLEMAGQDRQVRLYRPSLVSGYQPDGDAHAKECCVRASEAILDLVQTARQRCPIILRYWKAIAAALSAALTLYTDLLFDASSKGHSRTRKRSALRAVAATFEELESTSPARSAASLLRGLLVAELDLRGTSEGTTEDDKRDARSVNRVAPFRKLVKTVLSAAAQSDSDGHVANSSPSSTGVRQSGSSSHLPNFSAPGASPSGNAAQPVSGASPAESEPTHWVFGPSPSSGDSSMAASTPSMPWRPSARLAGAQGVAPNAAQGGMGPPTARGKSANSSGPYTQDDAALDGILSGSLDVEEWMRSLGAVPGL